MLNCLQAGSRGTPRRLNRKRMAQHHHQQLERNLSDTYQPQLLGDNMLDCVMALEAALLPCLPARELQAIDRSTHPSHQIDVERHARDFMEAAKKLYRYFSKLQQDKRPIKEEILTKEIAVMEKELNAKLELIKRHERLVEEWKHKFKAQLEKHKMEIERV